MYRDSFICAKGRAMSMKKITWILLTIMVIAFTATAAAEATDNLPDTAPVQEATVVEFITDALPETLPEATVVEFITEVPGENTIEESPTEAAVSDLKEEETETVEQIEEVAEAEESEDSEEIQPATPTDLVPRRPKKQTNKLNREDFELEYGDVIVTIGEDPQEMVNEMKRIETDDVEKSDIRSTPYAPAGTEYSTEEIGVRSVTEDDEEVISAIFIDTDKWKTKRGIKIGDDLDKVFALYGTNYSEIGDLIVYNDKWDNSSPSLVFQIDYDTNTVFSIAILQKHLSGN